MLIVGMTFLSACASIQTEVPAKTEVKAEGDENKTESVDGAVKEGALPMQPRVAAPDPMKDTDVPLELIKAYDQVKGYLKDKNVDQAIQHLESIKANFPKHSGPSYRLARLYLQKKAYDTALDAVETAISINTSNYYAQNLKGVILREQGKFIEAKDAYAKAIDIYPDYAQAHLNLGILSDIYLYDLNTALQHYETYMLLTSNEDKTVEGWLIDLKRRMPQGAE